MLKYSKETADIQVNVPYQSKVFHPQSTMQQQSAENLIRRSMHHSSEFIVRKSPVNSDGNETPIYRSKMQKQITADNTISFTSEKNKKLIAYYEENTGMD